MIKKSIQAVLAFLLLTLASSAYTLPYEGMKVVGEAKLKYMFWDVYYAKLYSNEQFVFPSTTPFALEFTYARDFKNSDLIGETYKQWQEIGELSEADASYLLGLLEDILVDVVKGDVVTLFVNQKQHSAFYLNENLLGEIKLPTFSHHFAAIWLSDKTTRSSFRNELLKLR